MFIDRPENAVVLIPFRVWSQVEGDGEELMYMSPESRTQLIDISEVENDSISDFILMTGNELDNDTVTKLSELHSHGWERVIVPNWLNGTQQISALGYEVINRSKEGYPYWIWAAVGLKSIAFLTSGLTDGATHSELTINGGASSKQDAEKELRQTAIILSAGKLPVSAIVESTQTISPLLGKEFFNYSFIAGVFSMIGVGILIYLRYRRPSLVIPIMYTSVSEIVLTLGVASLISWNMDLSAIAGVIAAVGMGVNDQIIITDEVLMGEISESTKTYGFGARIKKAFSIIFTAAAAVVFSMLPLLGLGMGLLKGFAITTIIGVVIGITVTRPAYGEVINYMIE
jgi:preprotein translocase subunit SecD